MANHDVVSNRLAPVGEAGLVFSAVIDVACPAVRLDTDCNVDLGHLEGTADVTNFVVVRVCSIAADDSSVWSYRGNTSVEAACLNIVACVPQSNTSQRIAIKQPFNDNLVGQNRGHSQRRTVILLRETFGSDSSLLLIDKSESQAAGIGDVFSYLVVVTRSSAGSFAALDSRIKFPALDWCTGKREGVADLQARRG